MNKKDAFFAVHPVVEMLYFVFVLATTMLVMHPCVLAVSLISAVLYNIYLNGKKAVKFMLFGILPIMLITAALNPIFNHAGVTMLFYMKNGNPVTLEAILYGFAAAAMFAGVLVWFSCYNAVMTSDKFIYLFGRIIPALSLLLSMALRFVPRFAEKIKEVSHAQQAIGRGVNSGNIIKRMLCGLKILSITITWALESAVNTADSMKSRGYGEKGRTAYSIYRFDTRDITVLCALIISGMVFFISNVTGGVYVRYYPSVRINSITPISAAGIILFALFCNIPMILNITEDLKWRYLQSKI